MTKIGKKPYSPMTYMHGHVLAQEPLPLGWWNLQFCYNLTYKVIITTIYESKEEDFEIMHFHYMTDMAMQYQNEGHEIWQFW